MDEYTVELHYVDGGRSRETFDNAADAVREVCRQLDTCDELRDARIYNVDGYDDTGRLLFGYKRPAVREAR